MSQSQTNSVRTISTWYDGMQILSSGKGGKLTTTTTTSHSSSRYLLSFQSLSIDAMIVLVGNYLCVKTNTIE